MFDFNPFSFGFIVKLGFVVCVYVLYKKMAKAGSPFFKIGYFLYTKTPIGHVYYRREVAKAQQKYNNQPHSTVTPTTYNDLQILPIPMSMDNYSYLITDQKSNVSVLVDPADPGPIQVILDRENITPSAILTTHKHWDHSDGNSEFRKKYRGIQVYGGQLDSVPSATHEVNDGDILQVGNLRFTVYFTPGHTLGHVVYLLDGAPFQSPPQLFSGDHLFFAGIGRMFEGSPAVMLSSLDKVCEMEDSTLVWPGHEYAVDNMAFAVTIDPSNQTLLDKYEWAKDRRKDRHITSPSTLGDEKRYNPFLRTSQQSIQRELGLESEEGESESEFRARVLGTLRARKDQFKYKL